MRAIVLAGRRGGSDTLAEAAGAPHRALLDTCGMPMLERVVACLEATPAVASIEVWIDTPDVLRSFPGLVRRIDGGSLRIERSASSPSRTVLAAIDAADKAECPVLVTTADHALLTPSLVEQFLAKARGSGADIGVGLVAERTIRARFPDAQRTYLPFRGERYSGANLFALLTPEARLAVEFWTRAEAFRKQPWKLVSVFGIGSLALFALRRLDLAGALERASKVIGATVRAVELDEAEAAVDVDRVSDWELVNEILRAREQLPHS